MLLFKYFTQGIFAVDVTSFEAAMQIYIFKTTFEVMLLKNDTPNKYTASFIASNTE